MTPVVSLVVLACFHNSPYLELVCQLRDKNIPPPARECLLPGMGEQQFTVYLMTDTGNLAGVEEWI